MITELEVINRLSIIQPELASLKDEDQALYIKELEHKIQIINHSLSKLLRDMLIVQDKILKPDEYVNTIEFTLNSISASEATSYMVKYFTPDYIQSIDQVSKKLGQQVRESLLNFCTSNGIEPLYKIWTETL